MTVDEKIKNLQHKLIEKCQKGDREAFVELMRSHQNLVFSILYKLAPDKADIEDIAQEVWVKVYQSLHKLKAPGAFRSWLNRITLNTFRDRLRQQGNHIAFSLDDTFESDSGDQMRVELEAPGLLPEEELLKSEWQEHLEEAIQQLPPSHRMVIIMREIQRLSYDEIAQSLDISLGTVKSRIARAREKLVGTLEGYVKEKGIKTNAPR